MNPDTFEQEHVAYRETRVGYWNRINTKAPQKWSAYYREKILAAYAQMISPGAKVLELGCGRGDLLAGLQPDVGVGVDFSPVAINQAKTRRRLFLRLISRVSARLSSAPSLAVDLFFPPEFGRVRAAPSPKWAHETTTLLP